MFSTKQLSEEQIATIRLWALEGAQLSDIQLRMKEAFALSLTYMDTRFLALDLGLELEAKEKEAPKPEVVELPKSLNPSGKVSVTMDAIPLPGALVSGKVIFSDGEAGIWMLDQTGRPALDLENPHYSPSEDDIMEFQVQLRALIESSGL